MKTKHRILFVCLGNICRSPMAEGVFRAKAKELDLDVSFDSSGTGDWHVGEAPDRRAQACMTSHGMDISDLRGRQFSMSDFEEFDRIYVMDTSNLKNVLALAQGTHHSSKVKLLRNEVNPGADLSVPDPYFGGDQGFEDVFNMLDQAADNVLRNLQSE